MIRKRVKTNNGEPLTLNELMSELNNLFASSADDSNSKDIRSMIQSLVNGEACFEEQDEDNAMTDCPDGLDPEGIDNSNEDPSGSMVGYDRLIDAIDGNKYTVKDNLGEDVPVVAFVSTENMMGRVVDTIRAMKSPTIIAAETDKSGNRVLNKAFVACGDFRTKLINNGATLPALVLNEKSGHFHLSINRKDGYDFVIGENKNTRFIIFDETVCPATIPADIVADDRKWGKRANTNIPQLIEKTIEENKKTPLCNLPENCAFNNCPHDVKQPIISNIMEDFTNAKNTGKVKNDTFVEFMKPENKEVVANAVATSIAERQNPSDATVEPNSDEVFANDVMNAFTNSSYTERWKRNSDTGEKEDDFTDEDTNPDCFRCIAEYMTKENVDSIHFYTDEEGLIHCDVKIKTVYKVQLEDSDKK